MSNIQFGDDLFEFLDFWPSRDQTPMKAIESGIDKGSHYLSFPLTDEQKAFLGNTGASHLRLEIRKVS